MNPKLFCLVSISSRVRSPVSGPVPDSESQLLCEIKTWRVLLKPTHSIPVRARTRDPLHLRGLDLEVPK